MPFEAQGERSWNQTSPGGFQFGVQGWAWGEPKPTSITFFLDGSAMVCDQYGRQIRRAINNAGQELRFADTPPEASKDNNVVARPQFATHAQVIAALSAENINWQAYAVRYVDRTGNTRERGGLTLQQATELQAKLLKEENRGATAIVREIVTAGWPQLPYEELRKLNELPPTPVDELRKIPNAELRRDALRIRREVDGAREKEMEAAAAE